MKRRGFTIIEVLISICVFVLIGAILLPVVTSVRSRAKAENERIVNESVVFTGKYKCVDTWHFVIDDGDSSRHRGRICLYVALKGEKREIFRVKNFPLYAQFESDKWYEIKAIGPRNDEENIVPQITSVKEAEAPVAEIDAKNY